MHREAGLSWAAEVEKPPLDPKEHAYDFDKNEDDIGERRSSPRVHFETLKRGSTVYPTPGDCIRLTVSAALHSFSTATARIRVSSHGTRRSCCIHCHQPLDAGSTFVKLERSWDRRVAISEASISCIAVGGYHGVGTFDQNADAWIAFNVWFDVVPAISGRSVTHPLRAIQSRAAHRARGLAGVDPNSATRVGMVTSQKLPFTTLPPTIRFSRFACHWLARRCEARGLHTADKDRA